MPETTVRPPGAGRRRPGRTRSRWWALAALSLSLLVVGLDTYVLNTALPTLSAQLGASTSQLQWITDAYTLAMAGLLLPAGQLGDRLGRRAMLLAGLALFGVASVVTSQVHTVGELIAMRAVMGAGAAVILPLSIAVLPGLFPGDAERRRAVAVTAICTMLGMPIGPLLAGWMLTRFAWGSVFLINGPVAALSLAGVAMLVPESRGERAAGARGLDWAGALLSAAGLTAVVYGIIEAPVHGWDPSVLTALAGGAVLLAAFTVRQLRAPAPLVDLRLFASRGFTWGSVAFAVVSFAMTGVLFVLTPYLQLVQGADAQVTGLRLLPMIGAMLVSAAVIEKSSARLGPRIVIAAGMGISAAGLAVLWRAPAGGGYGVPALALAVFGTGLGLSLPLSADVVLSALPPSQAGAGNALNRALQRIAVCLAPAILGSVLNGAYRARLAGLPSAATTSVAAARALARRLPARIGRPLVSAADHAYVHGMVEVALISAVVLAAGALLVLLFLPGRERGGTRASGDETRVSAPSSVMKPRFHSHGARFGARRDVLSANRQIRSPFMAVDQGVSGSPSLYRKVAEDIKAAIAAGGYAAGTRLPSESELAERYSVSRGTIRQAFAALRADGVIASRRGARRVVIGGPRVQSFGELLSFSRWARAMGEVPSGRVAALERRPAKPLEAERLAIQPGAKIYHLVRVRLLSGRPVMIERGAYPDRVGVLVAGMDLETGSITERLEELGIVFADAEHVIDAVPASAEDARLLGVSPRVPMLRERRLTTDLAGVPVEWSDDRYLGSAVAFSVHNSTAVNALSRTRARSGPGQGRQ